jgi:hypothetical protein
VKLVLDEMYPPVVAEQLRARGHDVVSVHDPDYRRLEGAPDEEIFAAALAEERALVTENVLDFRRLEADALARGEAHATLVFSSNRQFPRGEPGTTGRLVEALHALITEGPTRGGSLFLERPRSCMNDRCHPVERSLTAPALRGRRRASGTSTRCRWSG